jgi:hypothetical protein
MKKFNSEVIKTRNLADSKQSTIKITNNKGEFEIDEIKGIVETFEKQARDRNQVIKTVVRIPTILGPRTAKAYSGDWKLEEYDEYLKSRVAETGKFEKLPYIEVTVFKELEKKDYFS